MVQPADGQGDVEALLADVKAVAPGYPLRGAIMLTDPVDPEGRPAHGIPAQGEAWVDTRLAVRLDVRKGGKINVGDKALVVTAIVQQEPEVAGGLLTLGPKL